MKKIYTVIFCLIAIAKLQGQTCKVKLTSNYPDTCKHPYTVLTAHLKGNPKADTLKWIIDDKFTLLMKSSNSFAPVGLMVADTPYVFPPGDMTNDDFGNIYVCIGSSVKKILPDGSVKTLLSNGVYPGYAGIFADHSGNLYISDAGNYRVIKYSISTGSTATVAGGNGKGSNANQLRAPLGLFVDTDGSLYVADADNNRVQKWAPGATEGTIVAGGHGAGANANELNAPNDVFLDSAGNIYVSDRLNNRIQKWAPGATAGVTVAGGKGTGNHANQFNSPHGIWVSAHGNVFVCDRNNNRIMKWAPGAADGVTLVGGYDHQYDGPETCMWPEACFVNADGDLIVANGRWDASIKKFLHTREMDSIYTLKARRAAYYKAVIVSNKGCSDTAVFHVYAAPAYPGEITGQTTDLCGGGIFNYSIDPIELAESYKWTSPVGTVLSGQGTNAITLQINAGFDSTNHINVSATNACGSSSRTYYMIAAPRYPSEIFGPSQVSANQTGLIYNVKPIAGLSYHWKVPPEVIIKWGQGTNKIKVKWGTQTGNLSVEAINACGPSSTIYKYVSVAGLANLTQGSIDEKRDIVVYPNPSSNSTTVIFSFDKQTKYFLQLTDITGKVLLHQEGFSFAGENKLRLDVSKLAKGIYFVTLSGAEYGTQNVKLIKE